MSSSMPHFALILPCVVLIACLATPAIAFGAGNIGKNDRNCLMEDYIDIS